VSRRRCRFRVSLSMQTAGRGLRSRRRGLEASSSPGCCRLSKAAVQRRKGASAFSRPARPGPTLQPPRSSSSLRWRAIVPRRLVPRGAAARPPPRPERRENVVARRRPPASTPPSSATRRLLRRGGFGFFPFFGGGSRLFSDDHGSPIRPFPARSPAAGLVYRPPRTLPGDFGFFFFTGG